MSMVCYSKCCGLESEAIASLGAHKICTLSVLTPDRLNQKLLCPEDPRVVCMNIKVKRSTGLGQGSVNIFFKGLENKHFRLCVHVVSVAPAQLGYCFLKATIDNTQMNDCGCVPMQFCL